ncbi:MAG: ABC transporter ATP-binding protein [Gammaproteobacteria bacterium]|nr:ABC transporter ATP-binding protein [Gammaproteobacteria bacterium]
MSAANSTLLRVQNLRKYFPVRSGLMRRASAWVKAVDDVNFDVQRGETLGLVGESGCGKTTLARLLLRLEESDSGNIEFDGENITHNKSSDLQAFRRHMQIIFQDPYSSLNPRLSVERILGEAMRVHGKATRNNVTEKVCTLLETVGLDDSHRYRYPHEFSGGQRQRIGVARALSLEPELIVCDEAVSALDVSIQAQIINLLTDLKQRLNLSYIFISHDLNVVRYLADRVAVMYLGEIVETSGAASLFRAPMHPYTQALIQTNPTPDPTVAAPDHVIAGDVPSPANPPSGCRFHTRCPQAMPQCREAAPLLQNRSDNEGQVACHLYT